MSQVQLFISHSERDVQLVRPLAGWLQSGLALPAEQVRCTVVTNMAIGSIPAEALRNDLMTTKVVIGLLTTNSLRSNWAQLEMGAGWLQKCLHPIRGPGINVSDLPSPLSDFTTVGYCEKDQMQNLLHQLAEILSANVQDCAVQDLNDMAHSAEEMLVADMVRWFLLPAVVSAWRIDQVRYEYALLSLCTELDIQQKDMRACTTPTGVLTRDPEQLPLWAEDLWTVSKNAVNFMLGHRTRDTGSYLDVPPGVLTDRLVADMKRALNSKDKRGPLMRKWFEDCKEWIAANPPSANRAHSPSGHRLR